MSTDTHTNDLVLVSGSGRSGTSSLAGTLKRLGLHVPQPEVQANERNSRGYYEPRWVIRFHSGYVKQLAIHNIDSRPEAPDLVRELLKTGEPQERLSAWLSDQLSNPHLVIKDPHAFWFAEAWTEVCADLGVDLRWLTTMRHPAEVVGSRSLAYQQQTSPEIRLMKETSNVAGWVHAALLTEKVGRGTRRSFLRYTDLLTDWRTALTPVQAQLGLEFNTDLRARDPHPVDDFLDSSLRRSQLGWDDVSVPGWLRDMAEEIWQLHDILIDAPKDRQAMDRMDQLHQTYNQAYAEAAAVTFDKAKGETTLALRQQAATNDTKLERLRTANRRRKRRIARLERELATARATPWSRARRAVGDLTRSLSGR